jgi:hypothetical protein
MHEEQMHIYNMDLVKVGGMIWREGMGLPILKAVQCW